MKRLMMLLVAGILLVPVVGWTADADRFIYPLLANGVSDPTLNTVNPVGNGWTTANPFGNDCPSCACSAHTHQYHPGIDISKVGAAGQHVYAVANGRVTKVANVMADPEDLSRGSYILIKHTLPQSENLGEYFLSGTTPSAGHLNSAQVTSAYVHVQNVQVAVDQVVEVGDWIGDVFNATTFGDHLHFEMRANWSTSLVSLEDCLGYYDTKQDVTDFGYFSGIYSNPPNMSAFIGDHTGPPPPTYAVSNVFHNAADTTVAAGAILNFYVRYQNAGTGTWKNSGSYTDIERVELELCNECLPTVPNWFIPVGWLTSTRVKAFDSNNPDGSTISPGERAVFTFQAQVPPGTPDTDVKVWFKPTHDGGVTLGNWGGQYFNIHVRNPPPGPCGTRTITGCTNPPHPIIPPASAQLTPDR